jgi:hypothetical protein
VKKNQPKTSESKRKLTVHKDTLKVLTDKTLGKVAGGGNPSEAGNQCATTGGGATRAC